MSHKGGMHFSVEGRGGESIKMEQRMKWKTSGWSEVERTEKEKRVDDIREGGGKGDRNTRLKDMTWFLKGRGLFNSSKRERKVKDTIVSL